VVDVDSAEGHENGRDLRFRGQTLSVGLTGFEPATP